MTTDLTITLENLPGKLEDATPTRIYLPTIGRKAPTVSIYGEQPIKAKRHKSTHFDKPHHWLVEVALKPGIRTLTVEANGLQFSTSWPFAFGATKADRILKADVLQPGN